MLLHFKTRKAGLQEPLMSKNEKSQKLMELKWLALPPLHTKCTTQIKLL